MLLSDTLPLLLTTCALLLETINISVGGDGSKERKRILIFVSKSITDCYILYNLNKCNLPVIY